MFNSTGNNFGAGTIQFKDYQADNYVVLNSKIAFNTSDADYQAASQLEIYVPDLTIDKSAVVGVFLRYIDREELSGNLRIYDGGTVVRSWIKDKNTIVIEKLTNFDDKEEQYIYIYALYPTLNQGSNTIKGTKTALTFSQATNYLHWEMDTYFVDFEHWVFLTMHLNRCDYTHYDEVWEVPLNGFPANVTADLPFCGGENYNSSVVDGMAEVHIENGVWTSDERGVGFNNTGYPPFLFAFLVKDEVSNE